MKYKAIVFDLDGTLLNTLDDLTDSVNYIMVKYGYNKKTIEQVREYVGNGAARLIELCVPNGSENKLFDEIVLAFKDYYRKNCIVKTEPYPGILEVLRKLRENGVKAAVVSNKPDLSVKSLCQRFFGDYLCAALGENGEDTKKPSPKLVLEAVALLGVPRDKTVYIGDSEVDILTARNALMDCISVTWGFRGIDVLTQYEAYPIIDTPNQILDFV